MNRPLIVRLKSNDWEVGFFVKNTSSEYVRNLESKLLSCTLRMHFFETEGHAFREQSKNERCSQTVFSL